MWPNDNDNNGFYSSDLLSFDDLCIQTVIKIYLIKSYINQTMFCIASSRPSLIPPIITALDHAHMTDHSPND